VHRLTCVRVPCVRVRMRVRESEMARTHRGERTLTSPRGLPLGVYMYQFKSALSWSGANYTLETQYHRTFPFAVSLYIVAMKKGMLIVCLALAYVSVSGSWTPLLAVVGLDAVESAVITWTYDNPATTPWGAGTTWNIATAPVNADATVTDVSQGVSIYVRVVITHNNYEGIALRDITLQVDGTNAVGDWDIVNNLADGSAVAGCTPAAAADQMDIALQTIKARPIIAPVTPATFLPDNKKN